MRRRTCLQALGGAVASVLVQVLCTGERPGSKLIFRDQEIVLAFIGEVLVVKNQYTGSNGTYLVWPGTTGPSSLSSVDSDLRSRVLGRVRAIEEGSEQRENEFVFREVRKKPMTCGWG